MSAAGDIREHVSALILGTTGSTYTIAPERFHAKAPDVALERHPVHSAERAFEVVVRRDRYAITPNFLDQETFEAFRVVVRIAYVLSNSGGDLLEGYYEQLGPALLDNIGDRIDTDAGDIARVLGWHENKSTTPATIIVEREGVQRVASGQLVIAEIPFVFTARLTQPDANT